MQMGKFLNVNVCVLLSVCISIACVAAACFFACFQLFLRTFFFRLELVRTHIVDAYSRKEDTGTVVYLATFF